MFNGTFFSTPYNRILGTFVLVAIVVALGSYTYFTLKQANQWSSGQTTIRVTGTGEVLAKPDIAQFSFSVRGEGQDAVAAQEKSSVAINAIMEYLHSVDIADKDIKTEGYNLYPKYSYAEKPCEYGRYCPPGEQISDGFEVTQTITVKVRVIDKAGSILAQIGQLGATDLSGLGFTVDDDQVLLDEARALAIIDAQAQADILAEALGVTLVKMVGYSEDIPGMPYYNGYGGATMDVAAPAKSFVAPAVPTGENKTVSQVTLSYQVK
jgi:uncharacterized protein YggE